MKYKIKTFSGCTANAIEINDKLYSCDDSRYGLTDQEREQFHEDLLKKIRMMVKNHELSIFNIIELLYVDDVEYSNRCDQCGDTMITTTYEEFEID